MALIIFFLEAQRTRERNGTERERAETRGDFFCGTSSSSLVLTRAELGAALVLAVPAVVDVVAHEVLVDADAVEALAALEAVAAAAAALLERRDDELEAVGVGAPGVGDVLERDEVGAGEDEAVVAEAVHRLLAAQVRL